MTSFFLNKNDVIFSEQKNKNKRKQIIIIFYLFIMPKRKIQVYVRVDDKVVNPSFNLNFINFDKLNDLLENEKKKRKIKVYVDDKVLDSSFNFNFIDFIDFDKLEEVLENEKKKRKVQKETNLIIEDFYKKDKKEKTVCDLCDVTIIKEPKFFNSCSHIVCSKCYKILYDSHCCRYCSIALHCKKGGKRTRMNDWFCINHYKYSREARGDD